MQPYLELATFAEKPCRDIIFRDHKTAIRANAVRVPGIRTRLKPCQVTSGYIEF
ncbi:hypothetical protein ES703_114745 [subsurface metagenome]